MNTKQIQIPEGWEIDLSNSSNNTIVLKELPKITKLPTTWEDLGTVSGYFLHSDASIGSCSDEYAEDCNSTVVPKKEYCTAIVALCKLLTLRDVYRNGWVPDYNNNNEDKYAIYVKNGYPCESSNYNVNGMLSFQSYELRDLFLTNFKDLIIQAKELI